MHSSFAFGVYQIQNNSLLSDFMTWRDKDTIR